MDVTRTILETILLPPKKHPDGTTEKIHLRLCCDGAGVPIQIQWMSPDGEIRASFNAEDFERAAAAIRDRRGKSYDHRRVCPDHGYCDYEAYGCAQCNNTEFTANCGRATTPDDEPADGTKPEQT